MSHVPPRNPVRPSSPPLKRRRGRQPRPSLLSPCVKAAVARFAHAVGQPSVIEPAGFRDFRGWLARIGGPDMRHEWAPLVEAVLQDYKSDLNMIRQIKPDLVREIVKAVVIPREGESSKLVSTNCGRQCARPSTGVTLMTILDRMFANLKQWREYNVSDLPPTDDPYYAHVQREAPESRYETAGHLEHVRPAEPASSSAYAQQSALPPVHRILPEKRSRSTAGASESPAYPQAGWDESHSGMRVSSTTPEPSLPSFRELEDSLQPRQHPAKRGRG